MKLVSRQPIWKTAIASVLAVALIAGAAIAIPLLTGQSAEALAADIAQNDPQVKAALGGEEIEVVKVVELVDDEGKVICKVEMGIIAAEVDLETREVTEVERLPMPTLSDAEKAEAVNIATADPRVQELLDQGASIGHVSAMYSFGMRVNPETGEIEEFSETLARVAIELGEKSWAAHVDLAEGKVVRLIETTPMDDYDSFSGPSGGVEYYRIEKPCPSVSW